MEFLGKFHNSREQIFTGTLDVTYSGTKCTAMGERVHVAPPAVFSEQHSFRSVVLHLIPNAHLIHKSELSHNDCFRSGDLTFAFLRTSSRSSNGRFTQWCYVHGCWDGAVKRLYLALLY